MGAELYDVEIDFNGVPILYATKVSAKKNKNSTTKTTFTRDVTIGAKNTGGTISIEGLYFPTTVADAVALENMLNSDNIESVTCIGKSYTAEGDAYLKTISGTGVTVTNDEEEWSPTDGISNKLELGVDTLTKEAELL